MLRNLNKTYAGRRILGLCKTGVLGSTVPSGGLDGPSYLSNFVTTNSLQSAEVRGRILSTNLPAGTWYAWPDGRFNVAPGVPSGAYTVDIEYFTYNVKSIPPVTMTITVAVAPTITVQPTNQSVVSPAQASFTITATGTPAPTYQWQRNPGGNTAFADVVGATSASFATPATTVTGGSANSGDTYRCVVTNAQGSVTSNVVTLTVSALPVITLQPVAQTVTSPATATFLVTATGTPTPTYQWQRNPGGNTAFANVVGATLASYTTPATTVTGGSANSGDTYRCIVTNSTGSVTSSAVAITVLAVPVITAQPVNQSVVTPGAATFAVTATGTPFPTYQWQRNPGGNTAFADILGATASSYTTPASTVTGGSANNSDTYRCVVTNAVGTVTSSSAILFVNELPAIVTQPTAQSVTAPGLATFVVSATGSPAPTYQWQRNPGGSGTFTDIVGALSASYTTPATSVTGGAANNGDTYRCIVANQVGSVTSSTAFLTVTAAASAPSILVHPVSQAVYEGFPITMTVTADGTPPLTYQWQRNPGGNTAFANIVGATLDTYTTPDTTVAAGLANNGDTYRCAVTNSVSTVFSNIATITVNVTDAPLFVAHPSPQVVVEPGIALFDVVVIGTPTPTFQWQRNPGGNTAFVDIPGATTNQYVTPVTSVTGGGANNGDTYRCVASNIAGVVLSNAALLTVNPLVVAPSISIQPGNRTVTSPDVATFSITVGGTAPFTYQWQRQPFGSSGFVDVSSGTGGTTASYSTDVTSVTGGGANNGDAYQCVVTNSAGTVTSNVVVLTVNSALDTTQPTLVGTLETALVTNYSYRVVWPPALDNVAVTGYEYRLNTGPWIPVGLTQYTDILGRTPGVSDLFEVRAYDAAGNRSNPALQAIITPTMTALVLAGPSFSVVGIPSANFVLSLDTPITSDVTVTPSDGAGGGTFQPPSVVLTQAVPTASFNYVGLLTGSKNILMSNNGGLTNPPGFPLLVVAADTPVNDDPGATSRAVILDIRAFSADSNVRRSATSFSANFSSVEGTVLQTLTLAPSATKTLTTSTQISSLTMLRTDTPLNVVVSIRNGPTFALTVKKLLTLDSNIESLVLTNLSATANASVTLVQG